MYSLLGTVYRPQRLYLYLLKKDLFFILFLNFLKSLKDNRIGETRKGVIELCRLLTENCVLRKINLSGNMINDSNIDILTDAFEVLV